jgi:hypothetical protein
VQSVVWRSVEPAVQVGGAAVMVVAVAVVGWFGPGLMEAVGVGVGIAVVGRMREKRRTSILFGDV